MDAIKIIVKVWNVDVKPSTIENCFNHCKIRTSEVIEENDIDFNDDQQIESEIQNQIYQLNYHNPMSVENLLNYPEENIVSGTTTLDELVENLNAGAPETPDGDGADDESLEIKKISHKDMLLMLDSMENYWLQQTEDITDNLVITQKFKGIVRKKLFLGLQQSSLDNYFIR